MSVVLILNAVLAIPVVVGIVSFLGWAIVADTAAVARRPARHQRPVHNREASSRSQGREPRSISPPNSGSARDEHPVQLGITAHP